MAKAKPATANSAGAPAILHYWRGIDPQPLGTLDGLFERASKSPSVPAVKALSPP
jgi:hypothetical protein